LGRVLDRVVEWGVKVKVKVYRTRRTFQSKTVRSYDKTVRSYDDVITGRILTGAILTGVAAGKALSESDEVLRNIAESRSTGAPYTRVCKNNNYSKHTNFLEPVSTTHQFNFSSTQTHCQCCYKTQKTSLILHGVIAFLAYLRVCEWVFIYGAGYAERSKYVDAGERALERAPRYVSLKLRI
jgi:hypothetical protein